jgi:hypothetical protein
MHHPRRETRMTIIYELDVVTPKAYEPFHGRMVWSTLREGFWIGREDDRFAGVIEERWFGAFVAFPRRGGQVGPFPTLRDAQGSFEAD